MKTYDLIVIGAGPGGYTAALKAADCGQSVAIVEERDVGGTCLNRGCIPTKAMLHVSDAVREASALGAWGVETGEVRVDFEALNRKKDEVVARLRSGVEGLFRSKKVDLLRGTGSIAGAGVVTVNGETYGAGNILIATGSVPARPPIPGLENAVTSDDLLDSGGQRKLYESMVIIGGGVIGVELASVYSALGCRVTVLEAMDRILPNMDREICQNLTMILKKRGVQVQAGAMVSAVEKSSDGSLTVHYTCKDRPMDARGEAVLCAIGRRANTEGLFADGFSLEMDRARIVTNERYETSVPGIYAIGDVTSRVQLAHVASAQGAACAGSLAGRPVPTDPSLVPSCIYTSPEIASVGITADEAKTSGRDVKVGKALMSANGKTVIAGGERGFIKIVADARTGVILGAQLMCERATDMLSQFTAAILNQTTAKDMARAVRPHPTFDEAIGDALEDLLGKLG